MARVKISEFKAKELLYSTFNAPYSGKFFTLKNFSEEIGFLDDTIPYVVKVDQGIKKRNKLGLVFVNVSKNEIENHIRSFIDKGYSKFLVEEFIPHKPEEERFLAIERVREGLKIIYSLRGGIDIEEQKDSVKTEVINSSNLISIAKDLNISENDLDKIIKAFEQFYFSFMESNPFIVRDEKIIFLDLAVEVDSTAEFFTKNAWDKHDQIESSSSGTQEEKSIEHLAATSSASFKFVMLNPNGSLFTIFSGGGASIVLADEFNNIGLGKELANYAEYSGGPTEDETYIFVRNIISLALKSGAANKKIYIAGGVANFTDIRATFKGVVRALNEYKDDLKNQDIKIYVRRGGPFQEEGLKMMKDFLEDADLLGEVMGPDRVLTEVVTHTN